jgi:hypothetical protein
MQWNSSSYTDAFRPMQNSATLDGDYVFQAGFDF